MGPDEREFGDSEACQWCDYLTEVANEPSREVCESQELLQMLMGGRDKPFHKRFHITGSVFTCPCAKIYPRKDTDEEWN